MKIKRKFSKNKKIKNFAIKFVAGALLFQSSFAFAQPLIEKEQLNSFLKKDTHNEYIINGDNMAEPRYKPTEDSLESETNFKSNLIIPTKPNVVLLITLDEAKETIQGDILTIPGVKGDTRIENTLSNFYKDLRSQGILDAQIKFIMLNIIADCINNNENGFITINDLNSRINQDINYYTTTYNAPLYERFDLSNYSGRKQDRLTYIVEEFRDYAGGVIPNNEPGVSTEEERARHIQGEIPKIEWGLGELEIESKLSPTDLHTVFENETQQEIDLMNQRVYLMSTGERSVREYSLYGDLYYITEEDQFIFTQTRYLARTGENVKGLSRGGVERVDAAKNIIYEPLETKPQNFGENGDILVGHPFPLYENREIWEVGWRWGEHLLYDATRLERYFKVDEVSGNIGQAHITFVSQERQKEYSTRIQNEESFAMWHIGAFAIGSEFIDVWEDKNQNYWKKIIGEEKYNKYLTEYGEVSWWMFNKTELEKLMNETYKEAGFTKKVGKSFERIFGGNYNMDNFINSYLNYRASYLEFKNWADENFGIEEKKGESKKNGIDNLYARLKLGDEEAYKKYANYMLNPNGKTTIGLAENGILFTNEMRNTFKNEKELINQLKNLIENVWWIDFGLISSGLVSGSTIGRDYTLLIKSNEITDKDMEGFKGFYTPTIETAKEGPEPRMIKVFTDLEGEFTMATPPGEDITQSITIGHNEDKLKLTLKRDKNHIDVNFYTDKVTGQKLWGNDPAYVYLDLSVWFNPIELRKKDNKNIELHYPNTPGNNVELIIWMRPKGSDLPKDHPKSISLEPTKTGINGKPLGIVRFDANIDQGEYEIIAEGIPHKDSGIEPARERIIATINIGSQQAPSSSPAPLSLGEIEGQSQSANVGNILTNFDFGLSDQTQYDLPISLITSTEETSMYGGNLRRTLVSAFNGQNIEGGILFDIFATDPPDFAGDEEVINMRRWLKPEVGSEWESRSTWESRITDLDSFMRYFFGVTPFRTDTEGNPIWVNESGELNYNENLAIIKIDSPLRSEIFYGITIGQGVVLDITKVIDTRLSYGAIFQFGSTKKEFLQMAYRGEFAAYFEIGGQFVPLITQKLQQKGIPNPEDIVISNGFDGKLKIDERTDTELDGTQTEDSFMAIRLNAAYRATWKKWLLDIYGSTLIHAPENVNYIDAGVRVERSRPMLVFGPVGFDPRLTLKWRYTGNGKHEAVVSPGVAISYERNAVMFVNYDLRRTKTPEEGIVAHRNTWTGGFRLNFNGRANIEGGAIINDLPDIDQAAADLYLTGETHIWKAVRLRISATTRQPGRGREIIDPENIEASVNIVINIPEFGEMFKKNKGD